MISFFAEFLAIDEIRTALVIGSAVALITAAVGVLTVLRGQSFAGHALTDLAAVGGSAAFLLGINQLWGFVGSCVLSSLGMHAIGVQRMRDRDVATGVVLGAGMGLTSLFLTLARRSHPAGNASMAVLFGSLFSVDSSIIPAVIVLSALCVFMLSMIWRPALFSVSSPELAYARGLPIGVVDASFMVVLGIAVALGAISVGAVLSTALLVGPAACGLRVAQSPRAAVIISCVLGLSCTWGGIILSYESYNWLGGKATSPSFCIVALILICYLVLSGWDHIRVSLREKQVSHV
jgi:zinc/manganese transport system permease protein